MDIQTELRKVKKESATTGRPHKPEAFGRVKLTTSLQKPLIKWLKKHAIDTGRTLADVLEDAAFDYKAKQDS